VASATDCGAILRDAAVLRGTVLYLYNYRSCDKKTSCYIIIIPGTQKPGRVHTHPRGILLKISGPLSWTEKLICIIFLYICSRWERGRCMSSLKGFRYVVGMGSCVCVPAIYYGLVEGSLKIPSSCVQYIICIVNESSKKKIPDGYKGCEKKNKTKQTNTALDRWERSLIVCKKPNNNYCPRANWCVCVCVCMCV